MKKLGVVVLCILASTGCATRYFHQELKENSQQYRTENQVIEIIDDRFYAFAMAKEQNADTRGTYYIIGDKYIYEIRDLVFNPERVMQNLEIKNLHFPKNKEITVHLQNHDNAEQKIRLNYEVNYSRGRSEVTEAERAGLRELLFKVHQNTYSKSISSIGRLIRKDENTKWNQSDLQYFSQSYPIKIHVFNTLKVKDGHPVLNNMKGYGIAATVDLITLPLQLLSF